MRSYYAHLATTVSAQKGAIAPRPVFRSSAIFPVLQSKGISSRILFMGYWILKRHIKEISVVVTLRNLDGTVLTRSDLLIHEAKTFRVELADELERAGLGKNPEFSGSLEVEFFSTQNFFFPFPAVVINYYGPTFSTVVHTAQRIYNDFDDMARNSQTEVPESGFNFYADEEREPFIGMINGSVPVPKSSMNLLLINHRQETLTCDIDLGNLAPYATQWIYPGRHCDLKTFFGGKPGAAKINFQVDWIFPRLIVGNFHHKTSALKARKGISCASETARKPPRIDDRKSVHISNIDRLAIANPRGFGAVSDAEEIPLRALTITHSYYDCSKAAADSDYWRPEEPGWHSASLMVPGELAKNHFTNIYFYPIYSPSSFAIDAEVYNPQGSLMGSKQNAVIINAPHFKLYCLSLKQICQELQIDVHADCALKLIARPLNGSKVPARIKIGLDIGIIGTNTPCNICTNLQPFNPSLETKPSSFRWAPVLADQPKATVWLMNSSPATDYKRQADLTLTFFRESDAKTLVRSASLPPHGYMVLSIAQDKELAQFFQNQVGWMTLTTTNPYTTTYYFAENASGIVGGDHGF